MLRKCSLIFAAGLAMAIGEFNMYFDVPIQMAIHVRVQIIAMVIVGLSIGTCPWKSQGSPHGFYKVATPSQLVYTLIVLYVIQWS